MSATQVWYTVADCRTDLLALQAKSLRTFNLDPYEFVCLDNSTPETPGLASEFRQICQAEKIRYVKVPFTVQNRKTANEAHSSALCWAWSEVVQADDPAMAVIFDFDLFLLAPFSVNGWMRGSQVGGWPQGKPPIRYFWPGLLMFHRWNLPSPETISLDCGQVDGVPVDVGGQLHHYLARHQPDVRTLSSCARIETPEAMQMLPAGSLATYDPAFRVDVFNRHFVHYVGATGWDYPSVDLRARKTAWVKALVEKCVSGEWRMP